ncbi:hypothetical protein B7494_g2448 [Chlorociboria aeruginascens]|nr:hypothetical protein B7494_g2448 [Chlorociboria aeruginascens]
MSNDNKASSYTYKTHHLPTSDPALLSFLAGKFASLRLSALITAPHAFSNTFASESTFQTQDWITRLQRPKLHTFVAIAYPECTPSAEQTVDRGHFVGSATLLGPFPKSSFYLPESGGPDLKDDDAEAKWQMTAVYNDPAHRGRGVGKALIQGAVDFARLEARKLGRESRVRIFIRPDNVVAKTLYHTLGFGDAGACTLKEAYVQNGDGELVPADGGEGDREKWLTRRGIVMDIVVS